MKKFKEVIKNLAKENEAERNLFSKYYIYEYENNDKYDTKLALKFIKEELQKIKSKTYDKIHPMVKDSISGFTKFSIDSALKSLTQTSPELALIEKSFNGLKSTVNYFKNKLKEKSEKGENNENKEEKDDDETSSDSHVSVLKKILKRVELLSKIILKGGLEQAKKMSENNSLLSGVSKIFKQGVQPKMMEKVKDVGMSSILSMLPAVMGIVSSLGAMFAGLSRVALPILGAMAAMYGAYKVISNVGKDLDNADKILNKDKKDIGITSKIAVIKGSLAGSIGGLVDSIAGIFGIDTNFENTWKSNVAKMYDKTYDAIKGSISGLYDSVKTTFDEIGEETKSLGKSLSESTQKIVDGVTEGLSSTLDASLAYVQDKSSAVYDAVSGVVQDIGQSKPMQAAGEVLQTAKHGAVVAYNAMVGNDGDSVANLIHRGESKRRGYNDYNRGSSKHAASNKENIDLTNMTIGEIMAKQALPANTEEKLLAVGKYQVIPETMAGAVAALGINKNEKYTPELQEKIFTEYLATSKKGRGSLEGYIKGKNDNLGRANKDAALEWASIGVNGRHGMYDGVGSNHASISSNEMQSSLMKARSKYADLISKGMDENTAYAIALGSKSETGVVQEKNLSDAQPRQSVLGNLTNTQMSPVGLNTITTSPKNLLNKHPLAVSKQPDNSNVSPSTNVVNMPINNSPTNVANTQSSSCQNNTRNPILSRIMPTQFAYGQSIKNL